MNLRIGTEDPKSDVVLLLRSYLEKQSFLRRVALNFLAFPVLWCFMGVVFQLRWLVAVPDWAKVAVEVLAGAKLGLAAGTAIAALASLVNAVQVLRAPRRVA